MTAQNAPRATIPSAGYPRTSDVLIAALVPRWRYRSGRCCERVNPTPELQPAVEAAEAFLAVFLRRYVTYCARRGRYAVMNGAARLFRELVAAK